MRWLGALLLGCAMAPAWGYGSSGDAMQWLQRVATATQKLNYTGVFMYRSGSQSETSRITHLVEGNNELEHLEALDGSPREVIRRNDEVKCYLPESHLLIIEHGGSRRTFPALIPASLGGLNEYYTIRKGEPGRVAGLETQTIIVDPKDDVRYGRRFWVDSQSGMLLRASMVDEGGKPLETFTFTELRVGEGIDPGALKARLAADGAGWRVRNVRVTDARGESGQWLFGSELPGFRKVSSMRRQTTPGSPESLHIVFSDGLAAISVFIEPISSAAEKAETGSISMGAINVYRRMTEGYQLVVMGDVPSAALKRFGDGIERRH